jgi:hypothetical protein
VRDTILKYMGQKKLEKRCDPRRTASFRSSNAALSTEPSGVGQTEMAMRRLPDRTSSGGTLRAACAARTVLAVCRCGPGGVVMAEGVGRRIASSPIPADWLVSEALRRYPTTGEIFVQMTRLRTPVRAIACPDSAGLTVGACAARNRIAVTSLLAQLNAAAEGEEFVGPIALGGLPERTAGDQHADARIHRELPRTRRRRPRAEVRRASASRKRVPTVKGTSMMTAAARRQRVDMS